VHGIKPYVKRALINQQEGFEIIFILAWTHAISFAQRIIDSLVINHNMILIPESDKPFNVDGEPRLCATLLTSASKYTEDEIQGILSSLDSLYGSLGEDEDIGIDEIDEPQEDGDVSDSSIEDVEISLKEDEDFQEIDNDIEPDLEEAKTSIIKNAVTPKDMSSIILDDTSLLSLMESCVRESCDESGWALLSTVGHKMKSYQPSFNVKDHGHRKLVDLFRATNIFEIRIIKKHELAAPQPIVKYKDEIEKS